VTPSPMQACTTFIDDVRNVVSEEARAALREHHEMEHRVTRVLTRIEAVMLPVAVLVIWTLSLAHLPGLVSSLCESLTLAPNSLSALVRLTSGG
jgi:hypothetical protein